MRRRATLTGTSYLDWWWVMGREGWIAFHREAINLWESQVGPDGAGLIAYREEPGPLLAMVREAVLVEKSIAMLAPGVIGFGNQQYIEAEYSDSERAQISVLLDEIDLAVDGDALRVFSFASPLDAGDRKTGAYAQWA